MSLAKKDNEVVRPQRKNSPRSNTRGNGGRREVHRLLPPIMDKESAVNCDLAGLLILTDTRKELYLQQEFNLLHKNIVTTHTSTLRVRKIINELKQNEIRSCVPAYKRK